MIDMFLHTNEKNSIIKSMVDNQTMVHQMAKKFQNVIENHQIFNHLV
jgi:hypothetical protein